MGWLKLDDAFGTHPKVAGLSDRTFRAHVMGMLYVAQHLTDGFVPKAMAPKPRIIAELEAAHLWSAGPDGWVIHDYLEYNPSKAQVMARATAKAMGGAKGAASRWHGGNNAPDPAPTRPLTPKQPSTPRQRDVIADALARAEGGDPSEVPASRMKTLVIKAHELRKVMPGITPDEVSRRAANWPVHMHDATITGPAIVTHWARLAHGGANGKGDPAELNADFERIAADAAQRRAAQ